MPSVRRLLSAGLAAALVAVFAAPSPASAQAEKYPSKPVRIVVPYATGGGTDIMGRVLATKLSEALGGSVIVENKPGANSIIGATYVAKSPADGYTLLFGAVGTVVFNPAIYKDLPYDVLKDLAPISLNAASPMTLIVPASLPVRNVKELLAYMRANPQAANCAASGTPFQLVAEWFAQRTGTKLTMIPFKGTGESVNALTGGQVTMGFVDSAPVVALAKAGRVRVLAVTSAKRHPSYPGVPTLIEEGIFDREVQLWSGLFAPAGTPAPVINRLAAEIERIAAQQDTRDKLAELGIEPMSSSPAVLRQMVEADIKLWSEVAQKAGISMSVK